MWHAAKEALDCECANTDTCHACHLEWGMEALNMHMTAADARAVGLLGAGGAWAVLWGSNFVAEVLLHRRNGQM